jgi:hypothetical protein
MDATLLRVSKALALYPSSEYSQSSELPALFSGVGPIPPINLFC